MPRVEAYYLPEHENAPVILTTPADVDDLFDRFLAEPVEHDMATLYCQEQPFLPSGFPDHELYVAVDGRLGLGAFAFMEAGGNWATLGLPNGRTDVRHYLMGSETEFPDRSDIAVDLLRQAVKGFLTSGCQRRTCVTWQNHDL